MSRYSLLAIVYPFFAVALKINPNASLILARIGYRHKVRYAVVTFETLHVWYAIDGLDIEMCA